MSVAEQALGDLLTRLGAWSVPALRCCGGLGRETVENGMGRAGHRVAQ